MVTRAEIISEARSWVGVPWRHQGRTRENGIDCAGLPVLVGAKFHLFCYEDVNYPRRPDGTFVDHFRKYLISKPVTKMQEGDVLIFAEGRHPCHCGIHTIFRGQPSVIHAHVGARKVVEQSLETTRSIVGRPIFCFEFPDVEK
jgi:cell wall-associated NlpC family hydrolase